MDTPYSDSAFKRLSSGTGELPDNTKLVLYTDMVELETRFNELQTEYNSILLAYDNLINNRLLFTSD